MFRNLLNEVNGITIYQIFSLVVFSLFFLLVTIWLFKANKGYLEEMRNKPLQ